MDALEALLRLTHVQGLLASGRQEEAIPALRTARARIDARSTRFGDEAHRHSFRTQVPENAETLSLADRLLNEDGARS
jgi:hypothetical protein